MSRFVIEQLEDDSRWIVKDTVQGWFIPMESERSAEFVKERFDDLLKEINND